MKASKGKICNASNGNNNADTYCFRLLFFIRIFNWTLEQNENKVELFKAVENEGKQMKRKKKIRRMERQNRQKSERKVKWRTPQWFCSAKKRQVLYALMMICKCAQCMKPSFFFLSFLLLLLFSLACLTEQRCRRSRNRKAKVRENTINTMFNLENVNTFHQKTH